MALDEGLSTKENFILNSKIIHDSECITAFIVGAGAVENAWTPVLRALKPLCDFPLTTDGANSLLARLVYLMRWWATLDTDFGRNEFKKAQSVLNQVRSSLCREIRKSEQHKQIRVRPEFQDIVFKEVFAQGRRFMLVTTNWDNVVGSALRALLNSSETKAQISPLHIHGSIRAPNTLYLPTEMTKEPYRDKLEEQQIGGLHGSIWRGLEGCHRCVVYGLSLSPLDAELGQTLAAGWSNDKLYEIHVIAPDHAQIAHRVNLLLDRKRDIIVKGFDPQRLDVPFDYTVRRHS